MIAQRVWTAGVGYRCQNRQCPHRDQQPIHADRQVQSQDASQGENDEHTAFDVCRAEQTRFGDAGRAESTGGIRAALMIEDVVGKVAADLQQQGDAKRRQGLRDAHLTCGDRDSQPCDHP